MPESRTKSLGTDATESICVSVIVSKRIVCRWLCGGLLRGGSADMHACHIPPLIHKTAAFRLHLGLETFNRQTFRVAIIAIITNDQDGLA
jgi:hypothetical protein